MKKLFLTFGLGVWMLCPAFADDPTGIPASVYNANPRPDNCNDTVLGAEEHNASVSLKADFEANTITIAWTDGIGSGNGATLTVPNDSTSCQYDGTVTLPPNPTRIGYVFNGWEVVNTGTS